MNLWKFSLFEKFLYKKCKKSTLYKLEKETVNCSKANERKANIEKSDNNNTCMLRSIKNTNNNKDTSERPNEKKNSTLYCMYAEEEREIVMHSNN